MASGTPTTNLGLRTMTDADAVDAQDINYNSGILDTKIGAVGSTSLQSQVTALNANVTGLRYATSLGEIASLAGLTGALDTKLQSMSQNESLLVWFQTGSSAVETIGSYVRCEGYLQCVYVNGTRKDATVIFTGNDGTEVHLSKLNGNWRYNDTNAKIQDIRTLTSESATKEHANISAVETSIIRQKGDVVEVYLSFTVGTAITGNTDNLFSGLPEAVSYTRYALLSTDATSTKRARVAVEGTKIVNAYTNGGIQPGVYEGTIVYIAK